MVRGLPIDVYHDDPTTLSSTGLRNFAKSPERFHALHRDPDRPPPTERAGQLEGQLAHCATLEPDAWASRYVVGPNKRKNSNEWKAFEAQCVEAKLTPINEEQQDIAWAQAASIRALPEVATFLEAGESEISAYWTDPATGVRCRCRPDCASPVEGGTILLDVKTYASAAPEDFMLQVARMGYDWQDVFYSDGWSAATRSAVLGFVFVAVESAWPFAAAAYMLPDEWRALARSKITEQLVSFAECERSDVWPGYGETIQLLQMPGWVAKQAYRLEY